MWYNPTMISLQLLGCISRAETMLDNFHPDNSDITQDLVDDFELVQEALEGLSDQLTTTIDDLKEKLND